MWGEEDEPTVLTSLKQDHAANSRTPLRTNGVKKAYLGAFQLFPLKTVDFKEKQRTFQTPKISKSVLRPDSIYLYPQTQPALKTAPMSFYAGHAFSRPILAPSGENAGGGFFFFYRSNPPSSSKAIHNRTHAVNLPRLAPSPSFYPPERNPRLNAL